MVRDGSHLFHLGKRAGLHYSNLSTAAYRLMPIGGPSSLKNRRFLPRVEKDGLAFGKLRRNVPSDRPWRYLDRSLFYIPTPQPLTTHSCTYKSQRNLLTLVRTRVNG
jgi:hypothetical protein